MSRSIGDSESKQKDRGGLPGVISAEPDIFVLKIDEKLDFVVLASCGVHNYLSNHQIIDIFWQDIKSFKSTQEQISEKPALLQDCIGQIINKVIRKAISQGSDNNLTLVFIAFSSFTKFLS